MKLHVIRELIDHEAFDEALHLLGEPQLIDEWLLYSRILYLTNEKQQAWQQLENLEEKHNLTDLQLLEIRILKASVLQSRSKLQDAKKLIEDDLLNIPKSTDSSQVIGLYIELFQTASFIESDLGNTEVSYGYDMQALGFAELIGNQLAKIKILNSLGLYYFSNSDLNEALSYFELAKSEWREPLPSRPFLLVLNNIGMVFHSQGYVHKALNNYLQVLEMAEKSHNLGDLSMVLNNIAEIYTEQGHLQQALKTYERCLEWDTQIGNEIYIGYTLDNIGTIHRKQGDYQHALEYFLQSSAIFRRIQNYLEMSLSYVNLIETYLMIPSISQAQQLFDEFTELYQEHTSNQTIHLRYTYCYALMLKNDTRAKNIFRSQDLFMEVIRSQINETEIIFSSMIHLCNLLLDELYMFGQLDVLQELRELANEIEKIALTRTSYSLLAEAYLIKSQIHLLHLEINPARQLLEDAHSLAVEKGLHSIALRVSKEIDNLLDKLTSWQKLISENAPLKSRIELSNFSSVIDRLLVQDNPENPAPIPEKPVLFMIMDDSGIPKFTVRYVQMSGLNEQLIGAILTALNSMSREVFSSKGHIERIKHADYTLLIKSFPNLHFCYAFEGESFLAVQKIDRIIETTQDAEDIWKILTKRSSIDRLSGNLRLQRIIDSIITAN